ncbi:MAG: ABC transporter ATP-binding protein [Synergistaceae bacterium]|nr:ABC transporter ATP-binding protein [Synergistaceae bacterium]
MNTLILDHVHKSFARTDAQDVTNALSDINFTVQDGEFLSIVGPSGCGKSTIMRLIAGLIFPTAGTITLNGEKISGTDTGRGMVFQKPTLFPWLTVAQNLDFTAKLKGYAKNPEYRAESERLLTLAGLSDFRNDYPHQLSGGMAQRLTLIRTMINHPKVFLLDEPLGALDAFTRMNMQDEILRLWQRSNHIVLMVTHDIDEALYLGTRIVVMAPRPGRIRADMANDMPYPRNRTSDEFLGWRKNVLELLNFGQDINTNEEADHSENR